MNGRSDSTDSSLEYTDHSRNYINYSHNGFNNLTLHLLAKNTGHSTGNVHRSHVLGKSLSNRGG